MVPPPMELAAIAEALGPVAGLPGVAAPGAPTHVQICHRTGFQDRDPARQTTGLDQVRDEIIELGMVKFDFTQEGRIVGVRDMFSALNEPSAPIPDEVTALTGITDDKASATESRRRR